MKDKDDFNDLFLQQNSMEDSVYLKKYVQDHPDNKMAWYLLGRDYMSKGQHGKATYCFTQAGEVYEAFEQQAAPVIPHVVTENMKHIVKAIEEEQLRVSRRAQKPGTKLRAALLMLLLLVVSFLPVDVEKKESFNNEKSQAAESAHTKGAKAAQQGHGGKSVIQTLYLFDYVTKEKWEAFLPEYMKMAKQSKQLFTLVQGGASEDKRWTDWLLSPVVHMTIDGRPEAGKLEVNYYSTEGCSCTPGDANAVKAGFTHWQKSEEEAAVLRSAMAAYRIKNSNLPDAIGQLAQPYPNNVLPGFTPGMEEQFAQELQRIASQQQTASGTALTPPLKLAPVPSAFGKQVAEADKNRASTAPLSEPLRIIVDKDAHRLGLVSGRVLIRSYPVGLGGSRTPEGEFTVTEKVRNPNNKSNGEYGSRGMTLSDSLYAIHGTNQPDSIGKDQSLGCVRMVKGDLEELYDMVPKGTKVTITKGVLPKDSQKPPASFALPLLTDDGNPNKLYRWLN